MILTFRFIMFEWNLNSNTATPTPTGITTGLKMTLTCPPGVGRLGLSVPIDAPPGRMLKPSWDQVFASLQAGCSAPASTSAETCRKRAAIPLITLSLTGPSLRFQSAWGKWWPSIVKTTLIRWPGITSAMTPSVFLEEDCIWDPNQIKIIKIINPLPVQSSSGYGAYGHKWARQTATNSF